MKNKLCWTTLFALLCVYTLWAQPNRDTKNLDLASSVAGVTYEASEIDRDNPLKNLFTTQMERRWETLTEQQGAWVKLTWPTVQRIQQIWLVNQPTPYDLLLEPFMLTADLHAAKRVTLTFSDGTTQQVNLQKGIYFQIITLSTAKSTSSLKITLDELYTDTGKEKTGLGKIRVFETPYRSDFKVTTHEMFDMQDSHPVQSAKIELLNPGDELPGARVEIHRGGERIASLKLETIPARSNSIQQLWIPAVYEPTEMTFTVRDSRKQFISKQIVQAVPYEKNHFDGGTFGIIMANHNDLGFLDTQAWTANYRSNVLIGPALDIMKTDPDFKYNMESVEYLKEFIVRYPERREELAERLREGRFAVGASYVQNLQVHVGQEKLVRQFYLGRRWLLENFPGSDTKFYMNVDVPGLTYQMPQILKKSGIDYMVQGRFPWGFYYWTGLDGTSIPMFALRYTSAGWLLNPKNNTGWLRFQNIRNDYYTARNLPNYLPYDFNSDYLPPAPEMIPYVKKQNESMAKFAQNWNDHFKQEPSKQITPPKIEFTEPTAVLKKMFDGPKLEVETLRGDWPMSWAYFDEPGHREGLLMGRTAHNQLLKAEGIYAFLNCLPQSTPYPTARITEGWLANCWPDHGWGGNHGEQTDQCNVDSYAKSLSVSNDLVNQGSQALLIRLPQGSDKQLPIMVYNASSWTRSDLVKATITLPKGWAGLTITDSEGHVAPFETTQQDATQSEILFLAQDIPSLGYKVYYATQAAAPSGSPMAIAGDSIENSYVKVRLGGGGIASLYDKVKETEVLRTDKFAGGEVVQFDVLGAAWNEAMETKTENVEQTGQYTFKTIRATESPVRYVVEKEAQFKNFTLRERFILNKHARAVIVEADIVNWNGTPDRELRMVFPMNEKPTGKISYEIPFGTVEMGRDEIDYSLLPETSECLFNSSLCADLQLPYREAVNWVDVSSGEYQGKGCLVASDVTVHLFRDQSANPVDYPIVQHVLLSSRKSLAWNPENWFTQAGNHTYRTALYPHEGNWRYAYKEGQAFNHPLTATVGSLTTNTTQESLPVSQSFLSIGPQNVVISAVKGAESGDGVVVRFYEAEGRHTTATLKGFKPLSRVMLTNLIEYPEQEIPVKTDGSIELPLKPWEIITLQITY